MIFYGLKTCDTCRKSQKELRAAGLEFDVIDVRADGVSVQKLQRWSQQVDWKTLLNTRSATWRNLDVGDKQEVDAAKAVRLMATYPTLIKRPVIEAGDKVSVGWSKDVKAQYL